MEKTDNGVWPTAAYPGWPGENPEEHDIIDLYPKYLFPVVRKSKRFIQ